MNLFLSCATIKYTKIYNKKLKFFKTYADKQTVHGAILNSEKSI